MVATVGMKAVGFDKVFTKEDVEKHSAGWTPWSHRSYKQFTPESIEPC